MSIWNKLIKGRNTEYAKPFSDNKAAPMPYKLPRYAVVDVEIGFEDHKIHDIGAIRYDNATFRKTSKKELFNFLRDVEYICGHNIIHHDAKYLFPNETCHWFLVDTHYI